MGLEAAEEQAGQIDTGLAGKPDSAHCSSQTSDGK